MLSSSSSSTPSSASKNSTTVRSRNTVRLTKAALQTAYLFSEDLGTSFAERLFTTPRRHARPPRERDILAAARPASVPITLRSPRWAGQTLTVPTWRWGHVHAPTVLLVHGWEGRGSQLGAFVRPLVAAGLSVVAFDAPGHGDAPDHRLYLTDFADAIADVAAAVTSAGSPLHAIVAHSFGAAAVLLAHARHGLRARQNIMLAPNVLIDDAVARFARLVGLDDTDRILLEQRIAQHAGVAIDALRLDRLAADRDDALLVLHDRDDREVPFAHGDALATTWSGADLRPTQGLGHRRILRDDDVIAATVAFAREGVPPPASDLVREVDRQLGELDGPELTVRFPS